MGGGGSTVWNSEGKGGLSILEFSKVRGGLDEDAARGRVWIFSGIAQFITCITVQFHIRNKKLDTTLTFSRATVILSNYVLLLRVQE